MRGRHDVSLEEQERTTGKARGDGGLVKSREQLLCAVIDRFPDGIAVARQDRSIIAWNRAFGALLEVAPDDLHETTCCELFGCRTPGGPLASSCLTETAIAAAARRPDVRLTPANAARPLGVVATPVHADGVHVVFQVRPADGGTPSTDAAEGSSAPRLRVRTLGRTRLETPDRTVAGGWLDQRSGQLLKFLVCERRRVVPIDEIAEAVWPNPRSATPSTVRYFVHALRSKLEPGRPHRARGSIIQARRGGYTIDRERLWIDADEFEAKVNDGLAALANGNRATATELLERALDLYRGDFLVDEAYAEWTLRERERLRALALKPLHALRELRADDPEATTGYLERLAEMEPFDSEIQRQLLTLWTRLGQRSRAVRHYYAFRRRMLRAFGEQPSFSLADLLR